MWLETVTMFTFDPTVNIGQLVTLGSLVIGSIVFIWIMKGDIRVLVQRWKLLDDRMERLESEIRKLSDILIALARQEERVTNLSQRMNHLDEKLERLRQTQDARD